MWEFRREVSTALKEVRREQQTAMKELQIRLAGIEDRLRDSVHTAEKHEQQLVELVDLSTELDKRVGVVEAYQIGRVVERLQFLESAEKARDRGDAAEAAVAQANRDGFVRSVGAVAVSTAVGGVVLGILAFLWWLLVSYVRGGAP